MNPKGKKKNPWEDHYTRQARKDNYPARSVYKLKEIQQKYHLLKKGDRVLDLGCAPGSWLRFAAGIVGDHGRVVGVDLKPPAISLPANVEVYTADALDLKEEDFAGGGFNVLLSDMAPDTSGRKDVDAARSLNLCQGALALARRVLLPGGAMVCKIFQGNEFKAFTEMLRNDFDSLRLFKPQSCRKASKEIYIIGSGRK